MPLPPAMITGKCHQAWFQDLFAQGCNHHTTGKGDPFAKDAETIDHIKTTTTTQYLTHSTNVHSSES